MLNAECGHTQVLPVEEQCAILAEVDGQVMRCVRDQNGNHVVQKASLALVVVHRTCS